MLIIRLHNEVTDSNDYADYTYEVCVNTRVISEGEIKRHKRSDGWQKLVELMLQEENLLENNSHKKTKPRVSRF